MWLCTTCIDTSMADSSSLDVAGCRGWALLHPPPAPILEVSTVLPFYGAITSVVSTTANVTAAEGGIMDLGSVYNS